MEKIKRPYIIFAGLIILLLILASQLVFQYKFVLNDFIDFRQFLGGNPLIQKSSAEVYLEGDPLAASGQKIKISFNISKDDQVKALEFSERLGVSTDWISGMYLDLDKESQSKIAPMLPIKVDLNFEDKRVSFKNSTGANLYSAAAFKDIEFATGSARFSLKALNERDFSLNLKEPEKLLKYATSSGQISLSKKLYNMFQIAQNIDTINMTVNGKSVSGEIQLK